MNRQDRPGAMGKLTRECDPEREVKSHCYWYSCWQESMKKAPPKHQEIYTRL